MSQLTTDAGRSKCVGKVISAVCNFVCLSICAVKGNDLSCQHQRW